MTRIIDNHSIPSIALGNQIAPFRTNIVAVSLSATTLDILEALFFEDSCYELDIVQRPAKFSTRTAYQQGSFSSGHTMSYASLR